MTDIHSSPPEKRLQLAADTAADAVPDAPLGACRQAADEALILLDRAGFSQVAVVDGVFRGYERHGGAGAADHWYLELHDVLINGQPPIVDPTVQQFVPANYAPNRPNMANACVPPTDIPDTPVVRPDDPLYVAYAHV